MFSQVSNITIMYVLSCIHKLFCGLKVLFHTADVDMNEVYDTIHLKSTFSMPLVECLAVF